VFPDLLVSRSQVTSTLTSAWDGAPTPRRNWDTHSSSRPRISRKKCIHRSRSSLAHLPAMLDGIFRTPASSPKPYNSLTNMDVNQIRAAEFRHFARLFTLDRQKPRGKRLVPLRAPLFLSFSVTNPNAMHYIERDKYSVPSAQFWRNILEGDVYGTCIT
jgi:hypothetical protein